MGEKKSQAAMAEESYEEVRRKRVDENKKKLEELNLQHISFSLQQSLRPKPSPAKRAKREAADELLVVRRRSGRIANLPEPVYREVRINDEQENEVEELHVVRRHSGVRRRSGRIANLPEPVYRETADVYASEEAMTYAIEKAEEVKAGLGRKYLSFVKLMLQSHTSGGFWLDLPVHFCRKHLPIHDSTIVLVDEDGNESDTTYLAQNRGLSAGWRGFSINHELVDGDALVFQLIEPTKFKVYIIRASSYDSDSGGGSGSDSGSGSGSDSDSS